MDMPATLRKATRFLVPHCYHVNDIWWTWGGRRGGGAHLHKPIIFCNKRKSEFLTGEVEYTVDLMNVWGPSYYHWSARWWSLAGSFERGSLPPYIKLASTWLHSCDKCSQTFPFSPLFCFYVLYWMWLPSTLSQRRPKFWRTMHARLCSDLTYNCNNQSSSMLVEQMALLGTTSWKAFLCNHDNFSKLLSTFVDSRITNVVLTTCHAWMACVLWSDTSMVNP